MTNIFDVAECAGVSKSSVSRYFNGGSVSKESARKIEEAVKKLNYKPNFVGRVLRYNSTHSICISIPLMSHPFFSKFIQSVNKELYKEGYSLIINETQSKIEKDKESIDLLKTNRVDGLILVTHNDSINIDKNIPVVSIDRNIEGVPCITSTNYDSTMDALVYLYEKGNRHIGFIGGKSLTPSEVNTRYQAYLDFINKYNLDNLSCFEEIDHGDEYKEANAFLKKYPQIDACFAGSDAFAFALYRINPKLHIIAFDGCMQDWIQTPIFTSVKQNIDALAKQAVRTLLDRIDSKPTKDKYYVKTTFINGETA